MNKVKPLILPVDNKEIKKEDLAKILDVVFEDAYKQGYSDGYKSGMTDAIYRHIRDEEYESSQIKKINDFTRSKGKPIRG